MHHRTAQIRINAWLQQYCIACTFMGIDISMHIICMCIVCIIIIVVVIICIICTLRVLSACRRVQGGG